MNRKPYTPPRIADVDRSTQKPLWVYVAPYAALISYSRARRRWPPRPPMPTWIVLGPMPELPEGQPSKMRPTIGSGGVRMVGPTLELELLDGELPEAIRPALLEAAQNLVWARTPAAP